MPPNVSAELSVDATWQQKQLMQQQQQQQQHRQEQLQLRQQQKERVEEQKRQAEQQQQQQLEEEQRVLEIGIRDLAVILAEKVGKVDAAFQWLDSNNRGQITMSAMDVGFKALGIDIEGDMGLKKCKFFRLLDKNKNAAVCLDEWVSFWNESLQDSGVGCGFLSAPPGTVHRLSASRQGPLLTVASDGLRRRSASQPPAAASSVQDEAGSPPQKRTSEERPEELLPRPPRSSLSVGLPASVARSTSRDNDASSQQDSDASPRIPHRFALTSVPTIADVVSGKALMPNELSLESIAFEELLSSDLKALDLPSLEALAFVFITKFGSIDKAFKYFDWNTTRYISRLQWDMGMSLLQLDVEKLTGWHSDKLFRLIDTTHAGEIKIKDWRKFFESVNHDAAWMEKALNAPEDFRKRTPWKLEQLKAQEKAGSLRKRKIAPMHGIQKDDANESSDSDADCMLPSISESLSGKAKPPDEQTLQAMAEEQCLEDELKELNLSGLEAFAFIILAKCRTPNKAFRWFNCNSRRPAIRHINWDMGIMLLQCDFQKLTGMTPSTVFKTIDVHHNAEITKTDWKAFFGKVMSGDRASCLNKAMNFDLQSKAKGKLEKLKSLEESGKLTRRPLKDLNKEDNSSDDDAEAAAADAAARNAALTSSTEAVLTPVKPAGEKPNSADAAANAATSSAKAVLTPVKPAWEKPNSADRPKIPSNRSTADTSVAAGAAQDALDINTMRMNRFRERVRQELLQLTDNSSKEYPPGLTAEEKTIVEEVSAELGLFSHVQGSSQSTGDVSQGKMLPRSKSGKFDETAVIVCKVSQDWQEELKRTLRGIETDGSHAFSSDLTPTQRMVVHIEAGKMGMWAKSEGASVDRHLTVYNTADLARRIRRELESLGPGKMLSYPSTFTKAERITVLTIAEELGLWCHSSTTPSDAGTRSETFHRSSKKREADIPEGISIDVFNLAGFADDVRAILSKLVDGQEHTFDQSLGEAEKKLILCMASEMGLVGGTMKNGLVTIGRKDAFSAKVREQLSKLKAGHVKVFEESLTSIERLAVHTIAEELGLHHGSHGEDPHRFVQVANLEGLSPRSAEALRKPQFDKGDDDDDTCSITPESSHIAKINKVFKAYATGSQNGIQIFLRFPDLKSFVEDLGDVVAQRNFKKMFKALESVFDDTLQLQIDMGIRTSRGLTLEFFKVFIEKAAGKVGWGLVALLLALLDGD